jgi:ubiquitin-activating enzyme E1
MHNYPRDRLIPGGTLFWSGAKKPPSPIKFDSEDPLHIEYIIATATLRARMYGLVDGGLEIGTAQEMLGGVFVKAFSPLDGVTIATTEEEAKNESKSGSEGLALDIDGIYTCVYTFIFTNMYIHMHINMCI